MGKIDLREGGEAAATVFGKYDREQELASMGGASFDSPVDTSCFDVTGAAGNTSKQLSTKQVRASYPYPWPLTPNP